MMLDGDTESLNKYTFVVYSLNSSTDPGAAPATNLSVTFCLRYLEIVILCTLERIMLE